MVISAVKRVCNNLQGLAGCSLLREGKIDPHNFMVTSQCVKLYLKWRTWSKLWLSLVRANETFSY